MNNIVSLSGGKDSTAMLLMMFERGEPIHSVVFFDTGWEFPQMYDHLDKLEEYIGVEIVHLAPKKLFSKYLISPTYKWPDARRRWCSRLKINAVRQFSRANDGVECIGFAVDEKHRAKGKQLKDRPTRFPLIELGVSEQSALNYCLDAGFDWGGLYDHFNRVSCFCCPLKTLNELRILRRHYAPQWQEMLAMEKTMPENGGFHGWQTVHDLDRRFAYEESLMPHIEPQHDRPEGWA